MHTDWNPKQGTLIVAKKAKKRAKRIKKIICKKLDYIEDYDEFGDLEAGWYVVDQNQPEGYELVGPYECRDDAMETKDRLTYFWRVEVDRDPDEKPNLED